MSELDKLLMSKTHFSFSNIYKYIKNDDVAGLVKYIGQVIGDQLAYEISNNKILIIQMIVVVIIGSLFMHMAGAGSFGAEGGFVASYMALGTLLLGSFSLCLQITSEATMSIVEFARAYIPIFSVSGCYISGTQSSLYMCQMLLIIVFLCEHITIAVVIPLVKCYGTITLVGRLGKEDRFKETTKLINNALNWIMRTMLAAVTGLNVIRGLIAPAVDRGKKATFYKAVELMPGGSAITQASRMFLGTGLLISNSIGVAGAVSLLLVALLPVVKISIIYASMRLTAACVEPMGDRRFSEGISYMANAIGLLLRALTNAVLMFVISIAIMTMLVRTGSV